MVTVIPYGLLFSLFHAFIPGSGDVRLVDGFTPAEGRVEIYHNDEWGTVCDDSFTLDVGQVICQQLGFVSAVAYYSNAHYGPGNGPIMGHVSCNGNELGWSHCFYEDWGSSICSHDEDVGLSCLSSGEFSAYKRFCRESTVHYGYT